MWNKSAIVALVGVLALCAPVLAQNAAKKPAPARRPNCGESYVVGPKDTGRKVLTQAQVDEVLKTKVGEVEACWLRLPEDKRKHDATAVLKLEIDDSGEVQTIDVPGLPTETQRCIAVAAAEWEFPRTDAKPDAVVFSYSVALHAK